MMRPPRVTEVLRICMQVCLETKRTVTSGEDGKRYEAEMNYNDAGAWKRMLMDWVTPTPLILRRMPRATSGKDAQLGRRAGRERRDDRTKTGRSTYLSIR